MTLKDEIYNLPYGDLNVADLSPQVQKYIKSTYKKGVTLLKASGALKINPQRNPATNGYSSYLGYWTYTKTHGLRSHINLKTVWTATLKNIIKELSK